MSMTLLDWRRRVAAMYADVRADAPAAPEATLRRFRSEKDELFATHPDSPIPIDARARFDGLRYWSYDPTLRFVAEVLPTEPEPASARSLGGDAYALRRIGCVDLPVGTLEVFWMVAYGGGVFLPFRDGTAGAETYAAGRYLLDTVKGADLGGGAGGLVIDFNYAYHPSCAFDERWSCPLAPRANRLSAPIRAGERLG